MKNAQSWSDFADTINSTINRKSAQYGKMFATKATTISNLMSTSRGRDKISAIVQYCASLYVACMKYSPDFDYLVDQD